MLGQKPQGVPETVLRAMGRGDVDAVLGLSAQEFGPEPALRGDLIGEISNWTVRKSPTVVARSGDVLAGFARCKPNENFSGPRTEGQVAVLAQLAVRDEFQGQGIGTLLLTRAIKTLRMLGFSRVLAQFTPDLAGWYRDRGWTVLPLNHGLIWLEPHIQRDDSWYPELRAGAFSPILMMDFLEKYPQLGILDLTDELPIAQAEYDAGPQGKFETRNSNRALGDVLAADGNALQRVPFALLQAMVSSPYASPRLKAAAKLGASS